MPEIALRYGRKETAFEYEEGRFETLSSGDPAFGLTDRELGELLDSPIGTPPLEDIISTGESVLLVVPDATRSSAAGQVVNLLVRRMIAAGVMPHDIGIIFATGIHRPVTPAEKEEILTPFIAQRIKTYDHTPRDLFSLVKLGETKTGIPIELNRALTKVDHIVTIGSIGFHYFAGFTGGRKLICPGLASARTISATHRLAFDFELLDRAKGVGPGLLEGNPVHEAFVEAATKLNVSFSVNTIVNNKGEASDLICGDLIGSHKKACSLYSERNRLVIEKKRPLVVASCGGYPHDINMIQAHKTLDAAANACEPGGTIVLLAECRDGMGRQDFLDWFEAADANELATTLAKNYKVNGQTAWSLLKKAEEMEIRIVTDISVSDASRLRLYKFPTLVEAIKGLENREGYIMPNGSGTIVTLDPDAGSDR